MKLKGILLSTVILGGFTAPIIQPLNVNASASTDQTKATATKPANPLEAKKETPNKPGDSTAEFSMETYLDGKLFDSKMVKFQPNGSFKSESDVKRPTHDLIKMVDKSVHGWVRNYWLGPIRDHDTEVSYSSKQLDKYIKDPTHSLDSVMKGLLFKGEKMTNHGARLTYREDYQTKDGYAVGSVNVHTNVGDITINNIGGKKGSDTPVDLPPYKGLLPNMSKIQVHISEDGKFSTDTNVEYSDVVKRDVTISSNLGDQVVKDVTGKIGNEITVQVPKKEGYILSKQSVKAKVNPDGTITTKESVTYFGGIKANVTIHSNMKSIIIENVSGNVGDTVTLTIPDSANIEGYYLESKTIQAVITGDGSIKPLNDAVYLPKKIYATMVVNSNFPDRTLHAKVSGKVNEKIKVDVPTVIGYTPDKKQITAFVHPDGTIDSDEVVNYTPKTITKTINIKTNLKDKTIKAEVSGIVGQTVTVEVPQLKGYTADKKTIKATINENESITSDEKVIYTANMVHGKLVIKSNLTDRQILRNVSGRVGDTIEVTVPQIFGYHSDKKIIKATITNDEKIISDEIVNYSSDYVTADVEIKNNLNKKLVVKDFKGKIGSDVLVNVPEVAGYTPDKTVITATVDGNGSITSDEVVNYSRKTFTANVEIKTNLGKIITVKNVSGLFDADIIVNVPKIQGYTNDKFIVTAHVNSDGSITTNEQVTLEPETVTANVTIKTNKGPVTVSNVEGKIGSIIDVVVPDKKDVLPDKTTVEAIVNENGSISVINPDNEGFVTYKDYNTGGTDQIQITPNIPTITADVTIKTSNGDQIVKNVSGKAGSIIDVQVPELAGLVADKDTVQAKVNNNGTITVINPDAAGFVNYQKANQGGTDQIQIVPNLPIVTANVDIHTNRGIQTVKNVSGKAGSIIDIAVPDLDGLLADKETVKATINSDGTITIINPNSDGFVTYTDYNLGGTDPIQILPNIPVITANVAIKSNHGIQTVKNVSGKAGSIIDIKVPELDGLASDKDTVKAKVNNDGTITVINPDAAGFVNYQKTNQGGTDQIQISPNIPVITADVTIKTNHGIQTVKNITGKAGSVIEIAVPDLDGLLADKETVKATIHSNGTITVNDPDNEGFVTYTDYDIGGTDQIQITPNIPMITADVSINTSHGVKTVKNVQGKAGSTIDIQIPELEGLVADKESVKATVNANGTITVINPDSDGYVTYSKASQGGTDQIQIVPNLPIVTANVDIHTNRGIQTVKNVSGKAGSIIDIVVPDLDGLLADKETVKAKINGDGTITVIDPDHDGFVTYNDYNIGGTDQIQIMPNLPIITAHVNINTSHGVKTVENVQGKVGSTIDIQVPEVEGLIADKDTVKAKVNNDGTITVINPESAGFVNYQKANQGGTDLIQIIPNVPDQGQSEKPVEPTEPNTSIPDNENVKPDNQGQTITKPNEQGNATPGKPSTNGNATNTDKPSSQNNTGSGSANSVKPSTKPDNSGNSNSTTATTKPADKDQAIKKVKKTISTHASKAKITLYTSDLKVSNRSLTGGSDWLVDGVMEKDGKTYYRVSTNEWILAEDAIEYQDNSLTIRTKSDSKKQLINSLGSTSNRNLAANTSWATNRVVKIDGQDYYQVSTNEFVSVDDVEVI